MIVTPPVINNYGIVVSPGLRPGCKNSRESGQIFVYGFLTVFWCFVDGNAKQGVR